jgi:hypothetical protein
VHDLFDAGLLRRRGEIAGVPHLRVAHEIGQVGHLHREHVSGPVEGRQQRSRVLQVARHERGTVSGDLLCARRGGIAYKSVHLRSRSEQGPRGRPALSTGRPGDQHE